MGEFATLLVILRHYEKMDTGLVEATWELVTATALLVAAAAVPLFRDAADRRDRQRRVSSQLIPDMNILVRARWMTVASASLMADPFQLIKSTFS